MTREEAVQALVRFDQPIDALRGTLAAFRWDWGGPPLSYLTGQAVASVVQRYQRGELTADQVGQWANLVECKDDIDLTPDAAEAIFDLANPELQGSLPEIAPALVARLQ